MADRVALLAAAFDERLVQVVPPNGVTLEQAIRIEAMALLANYRDYRPTYLGEALAHLDWDTIHTIDAVDATGCVRAKVDEIVDQAGCELADRLIQAGEEEMARRGFVD